MKLLIPCICDPLFKTLLICTIRLPWFLVLMLNCLACTKSFVEFDCNFLLVNLPFFCDDQRAVLLPALEGRDLIARAKTGTGKTLAFGIPIIKGLTADDLGPPRCTSIVHNTPY